MFPAELSQVVEQNGIIAVVVIERESDAVPLAETLLKAGIRLVEITLRTPAALPALKAIAREVPGMICGAGTVLTPAQVGAVREAGAAFGVAPGTNPEVLRAAEREGLPFAPGVLTPSDIEQAAGQGCTLLKFFPAQAFGGAAGLRAVAAPYHHLGLKYIPLGGLNVHTIPDYLALPEVAALGGSWIAPRELISTQQWSAIETNAREALKVVRASR